MDEMLHIYLAAEPFKRSMLEDLDIDPSNVSIRYQPIDFDPLIDFIARQIMIEMAYPSSAGDLLIETLGASLAARLIQGYSEQPTLLPKQPEAKALDRVRFSRVMDYVAANITGRLTVAQMAKVACMSSAHFARNFHATTGMTPHEFVSDRRLAIAKQMLIDGHPIGATALTAGFSSQANFSRAFRRAMGMTPSDFRTRSVG
jgi:AraC family transcriptional regulator